MLAKLRKQEGFTLIELLIVVAIIGILAAIAIPQFAAYRMKGFNSAALSDVKNAKTAEESLFADNQTYGWSESAVANLPAAVGTGGTGALLTGPSAPATATTAGSCIAGLHGAGAGVVAAMGVGVSNGVILAASTTAVVSAPAFVLVAKHTQGNRVYAAESADTAVLFVQDDAWAGTALSAATGTPASGVPATASTTPSLQGTAGGGAAPNANWTSL